MHFLEEMTQSAISEALGVGWLTAVWMPVEEKALGEVRIAFLSEDAEHGGLKAALGRDADFVPLLKSGPETSAPA
jgi:DNA-binding transcriptional regulator LsrR (DeoR family)